jgi:hypothetical protein
MKFKTRINARVALSASMGHLSLVLIPSKFNVPSMVLLLNGMNAQILKLNQSKPSKYEIAETSSNI